MTRATTRVSRRRAIALAGVGVAGVAGAAGVGARADHATATSADGAAAATAGRGARSTATHQAGIVTPAQDRLHFVAFDVITKDRERAGRAAAGLDGRGRADDGRPGRRRDRRGRRHPGGAAGRHRRGARPAAVRADPDHRLRARRCSATPTARTASASPAERPAALADLPHFPGDALDAGDLRRRPLRAGLRQRPAGRGARDPQPGPDRHGRGQRALVAARLRAYLVDVAGAGHAAQPVRLQGRHRQPQGRGDRRCCASTSGCSPATGRTGWPAARTWSPARSGC